MHARLLIATLALAAFVACGGGGGGGGGNPIVSATPTPTLAPTPSPTPVSANARPATAGDTFAYAGSTKTTFVRPPQINGVIPSPNPTNSQTLSYTTVQSQSVTTGKSYNGNASAIAFTTAESDALVGGLVTTSSTSIEYFSLQAAGSTMQLRDLGGTSTASSGVTFATLYGPTSGLVDVLPETPGAIAPANDATFTRNETDADGSKSSRVTNANGTYSETDSFIDGTTETATANADGSGSVSFPLGEPTNATFVVGPPGASTIPITITYPAGLIVTPNATPTPTVVKRTVAVWYPTPLVLSTQSLTDSGSATIPAACGVAPSLVRTANAIVATATTVDPTFGELDVRTSTTYTEPGIGVACLQLQDTLQQFYDFSEQTGQIVATRSTPVQTTTTTQMLGLTAESIVAGSMSVTRAPAIAAGRAHFFAVLDRKAVRRHADAIRVLRASSTHEGVR